MNSLQDSLEAFLETHATDNNRDLIARVLAGWPIEMTILPVTQGEHEGHNLFSMCYPEGNKTEPNWNRDGIGWPLEFAQDIGSTGFTSAGSLFVAMDIDSIRNHVKGLQIDDLDRIITAIKTLDYVEIRRSTSGQGYHLYVWLDLIPTANHDEHAAVGRAILGKMCHDAQLDFVEDVDKHGRNTWIWSIRGQTNDSFRQVKASTTTITEIDIPEWRDHIAVVQRKTVKVEHGEADEESCARSTVKRDAEHELILEALMKQPYHLAWVPDYGCYHVHTLALKAVHEKLDLKGAFATDSDGQSTFNAFMFVRPGGVFHVVRLRKTTEHSLWGNTTTGLACIPYNCMLPPEVACRVVGGVKTAPGRFTCKNYDMAKEAAALYKIDLPPIPGDDRAFDFIFRGDSLTIETERNGKKEPIPDGWGPKARKLVLCTEVEAAPADNEFDHVVRHLVSQNNDDAGWAVKRQDGMWGTEGRSTCRDILLNEGLDIPTAYAVLGKLSKTPWTLVNEPFQAEFLSNRRWNRKAKRLIIPEPGPHPHFDLILGHNGQDLDEAVKKDKWCQQWGVKNGADWLRLWAASVFQKPKQKLPALFFWGVSNNTGKSAFHRTLGKLIQGDDGITDIHDALTEKYNLSLAGCVIGYVEDKKIGPSGYTRVKGWIDSPTIPIREMRTNTYTLPNYLHVIYTSNDLFSLGIESEDERFVIIHVPDRPPKDIPWSELEVALEGEAPHILHTLLSVQVPPPSGRVGLSLLMTESKQIATNVLKIDPVLSNQLVMFARQVDFWEGYPSELLDLIGSELKSPATFTQQLIGMRIMLGKRGISVMVSEDTDRNGRRKISIGRSVYLDEELGDPEAA
jgi:hypothetical protein